MAYLAKASRVHVPRAATRPVKIASITVAARTWPRVIIFYYLRKVTWGWNPRLWKNKPNYVEDHVLSHKAN